MDPQKPFHQFGIDFSSIGGIPEDPKVRLEYFRRFKNLIEQEREKIMAWHRSGAGGREVIQAMTGLIDEVIRYVVVSLADLEAYRGKHLTEKFALVAVGGYGRGELNPGSDIDLLFLLQRQMNKTLDLFLQDVISVLWGIGLEIGQSCRTVKECQTLAQTDPTIRTSMIEMRLLIGPPPLFQKLRESVLRTVLRKKAREFLNDNLKKIFESSEEREGVTSQPEPDIKNGPGGLRDYHAALWSVAVTFDGASLQEINRPDVVTPQELSQVEQSVDYLLRVRNEMHYRKKKKYDVLDMALQKEMAEQGGGDVKGFMRAYFQHATRIRHITEDIFNRCLEVKPSLETLLTGLKERPLEGGFTIKRKKLSIQEFDEHLFQNDRSLFLKVFRMCLEHGLEPDSQLNRLIRQNADRVDTEYIASPEVGEFLLAVLADGRSERILRLMHDVNLLARLVPEFGLSQYRISYDLYHRYTADEHALRMVRFLEALPEVQDEGLKLFRDLSREAKEPVILKLACLLHSLGKEGEETSTLKTQEALGRVFEHLNLTPDQRALLLFLIDHLHTLNQVAFHEDIHDPAIVRKLAEVAETPEKLGLLMLISYTELNAVAPGTWTSWKRTLLTSVYHRTRNYLLKPESLEQRPQATREAVYAQAAGRWPREVIDKHLKSMPKDYLHTAEPDAVVTHIRLIEDKGNRPFALEIVDRPQEEFFNLTLCGNSNTGLFKYLVGTLTARALNILSAQIFSRKDGIALIIAQVGRKDAVTLYGGVREVAQGIEKNLDDLFNGKKTLGALLKERTRLLRESRGSAGIEPKVKVENASENPFTVIRIEARDHPGMLYKIAHAFRNFGIRPHRAKIATRGGRGTDVFSVSLDGRKITFPPLIQRVKDTLVTTLLVEKIEELD